ncbi:MAG: tRNA (guanosine(46)-N7)-methyltransferase TrmB [Candidatus Cloacimonetes bacterium]|jgi:tRNA (guanine-N7-)-methyltransferase|nr:tRNA (guanosine(46)-N7)-methyltransferase TrmB [Candidatus Cloacimonadota bacterium]
MLDDREFFVLEPGEGFLEPAKIFENNQPLHLEIGSGKGEFLSQYAPLHPEWNFLGLEAADKRIRNILKKISPERHPNVRLMRMMVDEKIAELLPEKSVACVYIQHPDPWPKRRHHKRRLFQPAFLGALAGVMKPGAELHIATDHEEYSFWIAEMMLKQEEFVSLQNEVIQSSPSLQDHVATWYETEQRRQGFEPYFMLFKRI